MAPALRTSPPPGRGALTNPSGRFEPYERVPIDDGWAADDEAPAPLATEVRTEATRRILTRNDSPDVPFEQSINPYRGCEHGCIYCYARPSHAYLGLSAGLDFESRIVAKPEAATRLREELSRPQYRCKVIALGSNTDPYQPAERDLGITRRILEVLYEFRHPVAIVTKSNLVVRDLELLAAMARERLCAVRISVTTLDRRLARRLEPRAPTPARRLEALRALSRAGVPTGVLAAPMIPAINDAEMEAILEAARAAGASEAGYVLVRLPHELKDLFHEWLQAYYPERAAHVLGLIREARNGALYRSEFGVRMSGTGHYAEMLRLRFRAACARLGLNRIALALDTSRFRRPSGVQLSLL